MRLASCFRSGIRAREMPEPNHKTYWSLVTPSAISRLGPSSIASVARTVIVAAAGGGISSHASKDGRPQRKSHARAHTRQGMRVVWRCEVFGRLSSATSLVENYPTRGALLAMEAVVDACGFRESSALCPEGTLAE